MDGKETIVEKVDYLFKLSRLFYITIPYFG